MHTITSLAKELNLSRVGTWKILKELETKNMIGVKSTGSGKTSTLLVTINLNNVLVEKSLALYLTEEALAQRRWRSAFAELGEIVDFLVLYGSVLHSPREANDIDLIGTVSQKKNFVRTQRIIDDTQKTQKKKIHILNFTLDEFKKELLKPNRAFVDAVRKGVILFGQENFIQFMRQVHQK